MPANLKGCTMQQRFPKLLILLALGIFLYTRLTTDVILYYINERFVLLTLLAAVGLLLLGLSYYRLPHPDHDHGHDHTMRWWGLMIVALPAILGLMVPPQPLGAGAMGNRDVSTLASVPVPSGRDAMGLPPGERNILDWLIAFQRQQNPTAFDGDEANVIGFVFRNNLFATDTFMISRYIISCCVADATPIGLIVQWSETAALPDDQWVQVKGTFAVGTFNNMEIPILRATSITAVVPPAQPYLYR